MNNTRNYWCYRVDKAQPNYFWTELLNNKRLRQGWGYDEGQDLRVLSVDEGARRNLPIFNRVKQGDILIVPRLSSWGEIAIVEATDDWNRGYRYEIDKAMGDYGHSFPASYLKKFTRNNENVAGSIRATLKNPSRFWNINHLAEDVEKLLNINQTDLLSAQDHESRLESSVGSVFNEVFDESIFADKLYNKLTEQFSHAEWEHALVHGLKRLFPFYQIECVGGKTEVEHGTDILVKIPGIIPNYSYGIAIQVKDYTGYVGTAVTEQINKADSFWNAENLKLIDKIVIVTKANRELNARLIEHDKNINYIFANDLKQILSEIGKCFIGMK